MVLGFDVGNTTTVIGCYREEETNPFLSLRILSEPRITIDELCHKISAILERKGVNFTDAKAAVYSSVVPNVDSHYRKLLQERLQIEPVIVNAKLKTNLEFRYDKVSDIGADRIVNAVAAYNEYRSKNDLIIIDFGTATTFCVVLDEGIYQGGVIAPGLTMSMDALFSRTAKLPRVAFERPAFVVGTSTVSSIQSGFFYGWASMINGIVQLITQQLQRDFFVILTGGYGAEISSAISFPHSIDEMLTLKGLKLLYDWNKEQIGK